MIDSVWEARYFQDSSGRIPAREWLDALRDVQGRWHIFSRLRRLEYGNSGDHRYVGDGVWELRIHSGPGYRVYYGYAARKRVILLLGGDKGSQHHDIEKAKNYWEQFRQYED